MKTLSALLCVLLQARLTQDRQQWRNYIRHVANPPDHWRRQLWGTGARAPPRLPASYFGDKFLAHFCHFFAHSFPQGVIIVPKMPERLPINFNSTRTSDSGKTGS